MDWQDDSIAMYPFNDCGRIQPAANGTWNTGSTAGRPTLANTGTNANDSLCMEYRSYGVQLWTIQRPGDGQVAVSIDSGAETTPDL